MVGSRILFLQGIFRMIFVLGPRRYLGVLKSYLYGLHRVFVVCEYGRAIVAFDPKAKAGSKILRVRKRRDLIRLIKTEFFEKKIAGIEFEQNNVVFCGNTKNNEREFEFISRLAWDIGIRYSRGFNISYSGSVAATADGAFPLKWVLYCIALLYTLKIRANPSSARLILNYTRSFYRYFCWFYEVPSRVPLVGIVANDHSPSPVAFSMVLKALDVPRIYLQHAEISSRFPALDFEYSLLRNNRSYAVYRDIGRIYGDVYVLARNKGHKRFEDIFSQLTEPVTVVIYLTSIFLPDQVRASIDVLSGNPAVENVSVKFHPRTSEGLKDSLGSCSVMEKVPDGAHVAIVGNSSIVIELLSAGIKVYQSFALDNIGRDYYGFVSSGLVPEIEAADLHRNFWAGDFFDRTWRDKLADYDPAVRASEDDSTRLLNDLRGRLPLLVAEQGISR